MNKKTKFEKEINKFVSTVEGQESEDDMNLENALDELDDEGKEQVYEMVESQPMNSSFPYQDTDEYKDYIYARTTLYSAIRSGSLALNDALKIARESEDPNAYNSVNNLMTNLAKMAEQLKSLSENKNFGEEKDVGSGNGEVVETVEGTKNDVSSVLDELGDDDDESDEGD